MHRKNIGTYGEYHVIAFLLEHDYNVFTPIGDNTKADLIVETKRNVLVKIQIKTVNREKKLPNTNTLLLRKSGPNYSFKYTEDQVDYFAVVDMLTKKIAWVPSSILRARSRALNLYHGDNNKANTTRFEQYEQLPF